MNDNKTKILPLIPLRGISIFPYMVLNFDVGREKSINALEKAMINNQLIFLSAQKEAETDLPTAEDFYEIGTIAKIKQMLKLPGDAVRVLVEGLNRGKINKIIQEDPFFECEVEEIITDAELDVNEETEALMRAVLSKFEDYLALNSKVSPEVFISISSIDNPSRLGDVIASHMDIRIDQKQKILEALEVNVRLETLYKILVREIEVLEIEKNINTKVKSQINKVQKEYYLKEQMRAIQEELGQDENVEDEIEEYIAKLNKLKLSKKTHDKVFKEINRLSKVSSASAESGVIRTYVEWILDLPWNKKTKDRIDIKVARNILAEDHYGLEMVKERVLEYLAVRKLSKNMKGPILCLVGPPGVGKTSIAKSIARSLNRNFVRMSLGGVRDEAEIRGHRRTYVGSIPGRIITSIKEGESNNPVFLFDEIDKLSHDFRGDPASALLEVLDPEQNKDFTDHYLEVPFDLSKVMFVTTANTTETIPGPLLDRMEVIRIAGYTEEEKLKIAQKYLMPKQKKEHGLEPYDINISEKAVREIISYYTRESGVRNLEREIANVYRKTAKKVVEDEIKSLKVNTATLHKYLGKKKYRHEKINEKNEIGVVTGLAWTTVGGETLSIETTVMRGTGKLVLTGQLGDVMQESAKAGITYIRSMSSELGINNDFYKEYDIHIHIPEGAIPKDGPSAGISMCTSVVSALKDIPVRNDVAMTGEITLRGKVLPIGGLKEKVLAANRAGIKKIIIPKENEVDIDDIPDNIKKNLEFVLAENINQVLDEALVKGSE